MKIKLEFAKKRLSKHKSKLENTVNVTRQKKDDAINQLQKAEDNLKKMNYFFKEWMSNSSIHQFYKDKKSDMLQ